MSSPREHPTPQRTWPIMWMEDELLHAVWPEKSSQLLPMLAQHRALLAAPAETPFSICFLLACEYLWERIPVKSPLPWFALVCTFCFRVGSLSEQRQGVDFRPEAGGGRRTENEGKDLLLRLGLTICYFSPFLHEWFLCPGSELSFSLAILYVQPALAFLAPTPQPFLTPVNPAWVPATQTDQRSGYFLLPASSALASTTPSSPGHSFTAHLLQSGSPHQKHWVCGTLAVCTLRHHLLLIFNLSTLKGHPPSLGTLAHTYLFLLRILCNIHYSKNNGQEEDDFQRQFVHHWGLLVWSAPTNKGRSPMS